MSEGGPHVAGVAFVCVVPNPAKRDYHLRIETPKPNLVEGMRWLQSTFAMDRRASVSGCAILRSEPSLTPKTRKGTKKVENAGKTWKIELAVFDGLRKSSGSDVSVPIVGRLFFTHGFANSRRMRQKNRPDLISSDVSGMICLARLPSPAMSFIRGEKLKEVRLSLVSIV